MKKMLIFLVVIIGLFIAISYVTKMQQEEKVEENPYGKKTLNPATVDQLDDPNYQNIILPSELDQKIADKEDFTIYFYSPTCPHCVKATPVVAPLSEELGIDMKQFNLLEFENGWDDYQINSTPTIIHYEKGQETARIEGYNEHEVFENWFQEYVK